MIQVSCPRCRTPLAFDEIFAEQRVACPDCGASVPVPELPRRATVQVRLIGTSKWMLFEIPLAISVDGRQVGQGSVKKGFDVVVEMPVGTHTVAIGPAAHEVEFARPGCYEAEFPYSTMWGKYCVPPKISRVRAEEADDWPGGQDDGELIVLGGAADGHRYQDEAVLAEVHALQTRKTGWGAGLAILAISLLLFLGAAGLEQIWESMVILIPVLLFHEAGHYVAMRIFGYRNLRMFFIPFFGAGVTGQHYNIAGWKKAVVALAGPLPGIALGIPVGAVGLVLREPIVIEVATWLLVVNGFNLLPIFPLDGGRVFYAVLFVRHPVLDVVFRVAAALCLLPLAYFFSVWLLYVLAFFLLASAPMAYRTARIARRLGEEGLVTRSVDGQSIPDEAALRILAELRSALPAQTPAKAMAQHVANVFEAFNAAPPGPLASLGLLCLQGGGFVMALAMGVVIALLQNRPG